MDTSKQAIGSSVEHMINLLIASSIVKLSSIDNPCIWYFLAILVDALVGIPLIFIFLKLIESCFFTIPDLTFKSGYYGNPPSWKTWGY